MKEEEHLEMQSNPVTELRYLMCFYNEPDVP